MKQYLSGLLFVSLFLSFIPKSESPKGGIKVIFDTDINPKLRGPIGKAALKYYVYYGYLDTIYIHYGDTICNNIKYTDTTESITLAYSSGRNIFLCPYMNNFSDSLVSNTVSHEFFHAFAKDTTTVMPFDIFGGAVTVIGYSGLSIYLRNKNGKTTFYRCVEEGSAEVCASNIINNYQSLSFGYLNASNMISNFIKSGLITCTDLIELQKANDFIGFCAKTMRKPRWLVNKNDIESVMRVFMKDF